MSAPFEFALDAELWRWTPAGTSVYVTRTRVIVLPIGVEFAQEAARNEEALAQPPRNLAAAALGAVAYACTSASYVNGLPGERRGARGNAPARAAR